MSARHFQFRPYLKKPTRPLWQIFIQTLCIRALHSRIVHFVFYIFIDRLIDIPRFLCDADVTKIPVKSVTFQKQFDFHLFHRN